jgi:hypothetical protein
MLELGLFLFPRQGAIKALEGCKEPAQQKARDQGAQSPKNAVTPMA